MLCKRERAGGLSGFGEKNITAGCQAANALWGTVSLNQTNPSREAQTGHPAQTSLCVNFLWFDHNEPFSCQVGSKSG